MQVRLTPNLRRRRIAAAVAVATAALTTLGPTASAATRVPCPKHTGEVARSMGAVLWVQGGQLYGCAPAVRSRVAEYRAAQRTKLVLGPWTEGSQVSLHKVDAVWTQRTVTAGGVASDRISGFDLRRGKAWMQHVKPLGAVSKPGDATVAAVRAESDLAVWVTTSGTVVLRAHQSEPELNDLGIGGELIGEAASGVAGAGLATSVFEVARRVVIGSWPGPVDAVARTLRIGISEYVGGDDTVCSVGLIWKVTVKPDPEAKPVGATWAANNDEQPADCSRPTLPR